MFYHFAAAKNMVEKQKSENSRICCGTIYILADDRFSLVCGFCGDAFFTLPAFRVHVNEHFPIPPQAIKTEEDSTVNDNE